MFAASRWYADTVRLLLANGARVDTKDEDGLTALSFARMAGEMSLVRILEAAGRRQTPRAP